MPVPTIHHRSPGGPNGSGPPRIIGRGNRGRIRVAGAVVVVAGPVALGPVAAVLPCVAGIATSAPASSAIAVPAPAITAASNAHRI
jgi:hypothetical protein